MSAPEYLPTPEERDALCEVLAEELGVNPEQLIADDGVIELTPEQARQVLGDLF